mmetsp:Transcript_6162/g.19807  ORF Transcript_6162/g.19807 Transcript_6162/m.19807 type:complete len:219 (+) Transcript_6162:60-716(+)
MFSHHDNPKFGHCRNDLTVQEHTKGLEYCRQTENLRQCFDRHASTCGGKLGRVELKAAMTSLGKQLVDSVEDFDALYLSLRKDDDERVNFEEFCSAMTKPSGLESWARSLELWRPFADALSFFIRGEKNVMRSLSTLADADLEVVCCVAIGRASAQLKEQVHKLKAMYEVLDRKASQQSQDGVSKFKTFTANAGSVRDYFEGLGRRVGKSLSVDVNEE